MPDALKKKVIGILFRELEAINSRPEPFEFYTAEELWANDHTSEKMLQYQLNSDIDVSSRKGTFIDNSVKWISSHFSISESTSAQLSTGLWRGQLGNRLFFADCETRLPV